MLSNRDQRALQSVAVQFFVNGVVYASFIPRLPEIRDRINADLGTVGLILTLASLGGLAGSLLCSAAVSRFGSRAVMIGCGVLSTLSLPFVGFATSAVGLWLALSALLFFDVFTDVAMNIQGSAISARRAVPVMNRLHGLWSLGTVLGGLAASFLARAEVSLQWHLLTVTAILLFTMLFVAPGLLPSANVQGPTESTVRPAGHSPKRALVILAMLGAMAMVLEVISGEWAAFRLRDDLGASAGTAGLGYVAFTIGMVVGRLSGDSIITRVGENRLIRAAALVAGGGLLMATAVPVVAASLVGFAITGLGVSVLFPQLYDQAAKAPGKAGAGLGAMTGGSRVGSLVAPGVVGALAATEALTVGAAIALVTLPAAALIIVLRTVQARDDQQRNNTSQIR